MAMTPARKGVYIGGGLLAFGVIFFLIRRRATATPNNSPGSISTLTTSYNPNGTFNTSQVITQGSNPNLIMVSSANTNVNQYQNSSYLQALAAENNLSAALAKRFPPIHKVGLSGTVPAGLQGVNPGGVMRPATAANTPNLGQSKSVVTGG